MSPPRGQHVQESRMAVERLGGDRSGAGTAEDREEGKASCQRPDSLFGEFGLQSNRELWRDRGSGVTWSKQCLLIMFFLRIFFSIITT